MPPTRFTTVIGALAMSAILFGAGVSRADPAGGTDGGDSSSHSDTSSGSDRSSADTDPSPDKTADKPPSKAATGKSTDDAADEKATSGGGTSPKSEPAESKTPSSAGGSPESTDNEDPVEIPVVETTAPDVELPATTASSEPAKASAATNSMPDLTDVAKPDGASGAAEPPESTGTAEPDVAVAAPNPTARVGAQSQSSDVSALVAGDSEDPAFKQRFRNEDPEGRFMTPASDDWSQRMSFETRTEFEPTGSMEPNQPRENVSAGFGVNDQGNTTFTNSRSEDIAVLYGNNPLGEPDGVIVVRPGQTIVLPNSAAYLAELPRAADGALRVAALAYGEPDTDEPGTSEPGTTPNPVPRPRPRSSSGQPASATSQLASSFIRDLQTGLDLAGLAEAYRSLTQRSSGLVGGALGGLGFVLGINDMVQGQATNDPGRDLSGLIDAGSAAVAVASPPISIAATIAKLYGSWWAPLGNAEQENFLNHIAQCAFKKNTNQLDSAQAGKIAERYSGWFGWANMMSDHSRYKTKGWFGSNGCP